MLVMGIVGPPAGGKSTVARTLAEQGATWINADRLAHQALRIGEVKKKLRDYFGDAVFDRHGGIDRTALAGRVFDSDPSRDEPLEYIESVLHPVVHELAVRKIGRVRVKESQALIVLDAPLLIEAKWHLMCDEVWCLETPLSLRVQWIEARGWTSDELARRERRQLPMDVKRHHATRVISNIGNTDNLQQQVLSALNELQESGLAKSHHC